MTALYRSISLAACVMALSAAAHWRKTATPVMAPDRQARRRQRQPIRQGRLVTRRCRRDICPREQAASQRPGTPMPLVRRAIRSCRAITAPSAPTGTQLSKRPARAQSEGGGK